MKRFKSSIITGNKLSFAISKKSIKERCQLLNTDQGSEPSKNNFQTCSTYAFKLFKTKICE